MINAVLIETGKALRASDKESGRTVASANARLRSTIPSAIDNFHQALDEIEADIVRAKAVLGRDLNELRAKRIVAENASIEVPNDMVDANPADKAGLPEGPVAILDDSKSTPQQAVEQVDVEMKDPKQEHPSQEVKPVKLSEASSQENDITSKAIKDLHAAQQQIISPPNSLPETNAKPNGTGVGIDTTATTGTPDPPTQEPTIDSLFDVNDGDDGDNNAGSGLNFNMDYSLQDSNANIQNQDQSLQNNEFDMSSFGRPQDGNDDFGMLDLQQPSGTPTANKKMDLTGDLSSIPANGVDNNTLDPEMDFGIVGADESDFDSIFFGNNEDADMSGGVGEMEHGQFDDDFFGLNN